MNPSSHHGEGPKNGQSGRARPNLLGAKTVPGSQVASASGLGDYRILAEFDGSEARRPSGSNAMPWRAIVLGGVLVVGAALAWSQWSARKSAAPAITATAAAGTAHDAAKGVNVATAVQAVPAAPAAVSKFDTAAPIETVAPAAPTHAEATAAATATPATSAADPGTPNVKLPPKAATKVVAVTPAVTKATAVTAPKATPAKPAVVVAKAVPADAAKPSASTTASSLNDNSTLAPPASAVRVQRDPDEDLIAALIAHLSRSKTGSGSTAQAAAATSGTMDQLARCVAAGQSTTDCRARLCEGRWGKDAACPQPLPARP